MPHLFNIKKNPPWKNRWYKKTENLNKRKDWLISKYS